MDGHINLIALPYITQDEYESVNLEDFPNYRVYESVTTDANK